ncbi:MAG: hypothetical protein RLZZ397_1176 [Pseudomonadota bacterium]|jgi:cell division protein FtsB
MKLPVLRHPLTWVLGVLLFVLQLQLWFGRGGLPDVLSLRSDLREQQRLNQVQETRNQELSNQIENLKSGTDAIEGHARRDLGLVKPNEIFVQYPVPAPATGKANDSKNKTNAN